MTWDPLDPWEKRAVKWALVTFLVYAFFIAFMIWLHGGFK